MACFIVTAVEAGVSAIATKVVEKKEQSSLEKTGTEVEAVKVPFSRKLGWLRNMLAGGSALLAFEHIWHGDVTPWFPFLTAAANAEDAAEMFHEMGTVGVGMAALVTAVWGGMLAVSAVIEKRAAKAAKEEPEG